jgi:hypothetical protein
LRGSREVFEQVGVSGRETGGRLPTEVIEPMAAFRLIRSSYRTWEFCHKAYDGVLGRRFCILSHYYPGGFVCRARGLLWRP